MEGSQNVQKFVHMVYGRPLMLGLQNEHHFIFTNYAKMGQVTNNAKDHSSQMTPLKSFHCGTRTANIKLLCFQTLS